MNPHELPQHADADQKKQIENARAILATGRVRTTVLAGLRGVRPESLEPHLTFPTTLDTDFLPTILAAPARPLKNRILPAEVALLNHNGRRLCATSWGVALEDDIGEIVAPSETSPEAWSLLEPFVLPLATLDRLAGSIGKGRRGYLTSQMKDLDQLLAALKSVQRLIGRFDSHHGLELEILCNFSHARLRAKRKAVIEQPVVQGALRELVAALAMAYKQLFGRPSGRYQSSDSPFIRFAQAFLWAVGIRSYTDASIKDALYPRSNSKGVRKPKKIE